MRRSMTALRDHVDKATNGCAVCRNLDRKDEIA